MHPEGPRGHRLGEQRRHREFQRLRICGWEANGAALSALSGINACSEKEGKEEAQRTVGALSSGSPRASSHGSFHGFPSYGRTCSAAPGGVRAPPGPSEGRTVRGQRRRGVLEAEPRGLHLTPTLAGREVGKERRQGPVSLDKVPGRPWGPPPL